MRNPEAQKHLRSMRAGDLALYYHTGSERAVVGLATVARDAFPDPTAAEGVCQPEAGRAAVRVEQQRAHPQELRHPRLGEVHAGLAHPRIRAGGEHVGGDLPAALDLVHGSRPRLRVDRAALPGHAAEDGVGTVEEVVHGEAEGFDVRDIGLRSAKDPQIAEYAQAEKLCLITGDYDFADIRNYPPDRYSGIVVLRAYPKRPEALKAIKAQARWISAR